VEHTRVKSGRHGSNPYHNLRLITSVEARKGQWLRRGDWDGAKHNAIQMTYWCVAERYFHL
jgi:hypothetical protein